jgi:hypothetical protein
MDGRRGQLVSESSPIRRIILCLSGKYSHLRNANLERDDGKTIGKDGLTPFLNVVAEKLNK